jgi:LPS export ABC transporter protein LptC
MPVGERRLPALRPPARPAAALLLAIIAAGASTAAAPLEPADPPAKVPAVQSEIYVTGMTFVVSRPGEGDLVLESRRATLYPEANLAVLYEARVRGSEGPSADGFDVRCRRGELDLSSNDFLAEGDVHGSTADGQRYQAEWVRYRRAQALLHTDAPVVLREGGGTLRGDGFRYHLREGRFELLGNVSVVHQP